VLRLEVLAGEAAAAGETITLSLHESAVLDTGMSNTSLNIILLTAHSKAAYRYICGTIYYRYICGTVHYRYICGTIYYRYICGTIYYRYI